MKSFGTVFRLWRVRPLARPINRDSTQEEEEVLSGFSTRIQCFGARQWFLPILLAAVVCSGWPITSAVADDHQSGHPILTVQLDFDAFNESKLGRSLIQAGTNLAAQQLEKDPEEAMTAVIESLGFDPMEQEIRIAAQVSSFDDPMDGLIIDVQMKDSTGNLEGLLLAAPGYQETKVGGQTFHSVSMDGETFFIAFCDGSNGKKRMIAGPSQSAITDCIDAIKTGSASDVDSGGEMVLVQLHQMPEELSEVPPVANIAGMIRETSLSIAESDGQLITTISLTADSEER
ncbi:MAG: hypothetical protein AAGJ83_14945, partial [Planctomycetota bacterium]